MAKYMEWHIVTCDLHRNAWSRAYAPFLAIISRQFALAFRFKILVCWKFKLTILNFQVSMLKIQVTNLKIQDKIKIKVALLGFRMFTPNCVILKEYAWV
jgi:hypothetical protein